MKRVKSLKYWIFGKIFQQLKDQPPKSEYHIFLKMYVQQILKYLSTNLWAHIPSQLLSFAVSSRSDKDEGMRQHRIH